ncbi:hypothetical protein UlMin_011470 [Ulmus minor]
MSTIYLFLSLLIWISPKTKAADPTYIFHDCPNTTTFTPNSTYQSNLQHLLSTLSSNSTREFYNATASRDPSSTVYGLFFCRGDLTTDLCREFVTFAVKDAVNRCPVEKVTAIFYEECQLRYSNRSFFGNVDTNPNRILFNTANITEKSAAAEAAKSGSGQKKYATKEVNFSSFQTLYNLVQCSPDLSTLDCNRCLQMAIPNLPFGKLGGRVIFPSCNVRYELYPFYTENSTVVPPPSGSVPTTKGKSKISSLTIVAIVVPIAVSLVLFVMGYCLITRRAKKKYNVVEQPNDAGNDITTVELQFDLATIEAATNNFATDCKLGEGGFGAVYKGRLPNGQEIAVKRLSKTSGQGIGEFKNEVVLLAKLQHRNLVRLSGFCFEGGEKILVYEFVPNKSLDFILYDPEKQGQLDWSRRYKLIAGIARGLLYLHEDSRLRIIHRDLKASNILLDADLSPKISDFGMARIFGVDQTRGNTSKIVGTYGYMAPEYAMHGQFSVKSDVYSFGVLIFEIISGKKNTTFCQSDGSRDLLSYAWKLWNDGRPCELLDPTIRESYSENEVARCVHMGLLCVQEAPEDRPSMTTLVLMLNSYSVTLPVPQHPAFYGWTKSDEDPLKEQYTSDEIPLSVNEASISELYPR